MWNDGLGETTGYSEVLPGVIAVEVFSKGRCAELCALTENGRWKTSTVAAVRDFAVIERVDSADRFAESINPLSMAGLIDTVVHEIKQTVTTAFNAYWKLNCNSIASPQFTRYHNGHFIKNHADTGDPFPNRIGSVVVYLTDDYLGGEIRFELFGKAIKPPRGTALIFPSQYVHEVLPLIRGEKRIFLCFIEP